ncbi:MAG: Gfo/Idh/MocA family oxidoreductase [Armatimonadetes bacterium]|nr:Gfo/Idh/MocA family oxidoreductase [Armatimonadota bacterium]
MATLNIGIIGAGGIVRRRHLPELKLIPAVRVVAVCNRTRATAEAVAQEWGIPRVTTDWHDVLAMDDVDAVFIGTWPNMHAEVSIAALNAGKHVFCQARMARNLAEARAMLRAAREHPDRATMLCPAPHGMRGDRVIRRLLSEGFLGEPREVHATGFSAANLDPKTPLHWRQNFDIQGYNTLTLGMWIEVIHRWLGTHRLVTAILKTHTPLRADPETGVCVPVRIAESVAIAAEMENGALAGYHFSGVAPNAPHNRIEIYGTGGTLIYDLDTDEIFGARSDEQGRRPIPIPPGEAREWTVEADFVRAVREGGATEPSFADGVRYMEFTEAVYLSAQRRETIALPLPE